jgi:hypothetical protein
LKLADRAQEREELKLRQVQLNLSAFYGECRALLPTADFLEEVRPEDRAKDKERIKRFHNELDEYRARKESLDNFVVPDGATSDVDQKQTVANFLATVVYEAEALGISYEKVYYPNNSLVLEKFKSTAQVISSLPSSVALPPEQLLYERPMMEEEVRSPENVVGMSLQRHGQLLVREWEEEESPQHHVRPCRDFLEYKRRRVDKYYFGSDDDGECKDLRKNISTSFKKFMQLQTFSRAVSATSEN